MILTPLNEESKAAPIHNMTASLAVLKLYSLMIIVLQDPPSAETLDVEYIFGLQTIAFRL